MPIYEYVCESCGQSVEVMQKMGETLKECPSCKRPALKKRISAAGFQLKGSGWYATDFRGKDTKDKKTEEKSSEGSEKPAAACGGGTCGCH